MHLLRSAGAAAGMLVVTGLIASCADAARTTRPSSELRTGAPRVMSATLPDVRVAELHYDNVGTDVGEAIEISAPMSVNLEGWQVVLYNGSTGFTYDTDAITTQMVGSPRNVCPGGQRYIVVVSYPSNGIQNGSPDGIALVSPTGVVSEFISYEGVFSANDGPLLSLPLPRLSSDIGVSEVGEATQGTSPVVVQSLKRMGDGRWTAPSPSGFEANSFGTCNDHEAPPPPAVVASITIDPTAATVVVGGTQSFEAKAFDASGNAIADASITWSSSDDNIAVVNAAGVATGRAPGSVDIRATSGAVTQTARLQVNEPEPDAPTGPLNIVEIHYDDAGADAEERIEVLGPARMNLAGWSLVLYNGSNNAPYGTIALSGVLTDQCNGFGVKFVDAPGLQNGAPDGIALVNPAGKAVEFLSYEGAMRTETGPAAGMDATVLPRSENGEPDGRSLQKDNLGWYGPAPASFGQCNTVPAPSIRMFGRDFDDPALPVGFEFQLFAEYDNGRGEETPTTFTWMSDDLSLLTVDQDGIVKAHGIGRGVIRAIAADGTVGTFTVPTQAATPSATAQYGNHVEFGVPTDADVSDDHLVQYPQYTLSYSKTRNTPNWVSFNLETSHIGADRCDCFTFDQSLPADFTRYSTAHYVGTLDFYGFQYDRGHLLRSFDRAGVLDNARTFYLSNIIPQTADNNQGPWSALEIHLGGLAQMQNKELYVIAGVAGDRGKLMNKGIVTIPEYVWKVAVIMPRDRGLRDVQATSDVEIVAVLMPNLPGIRNVPWETYKTTINAIEAASGYDVLALLDDRIEAVLETGMQDEVALVESLVTAGRLEAGNANALISKLEAAAASVERGDAIAAVNQLEAFMNQVQALGRSRRLGGSDVSALNSAAQALIASIAS